MAARQHFPWLAMPDMLQPERVSRPYVALNITGNRYLNMPPIIQIMSIKLEITAPPSISADKERSLPGYRIPAARLRCAGSAAALPHPYLQSDDNRDKGESN